MEKGRFMRILKLEFQKIMKNLMLWLLAVIFCIVNCFIIYNEAGNKDTSKELEIMHHIITKTDDVTNTYQDKNETKQLSKAYQEYNQDFYPGQYYEIHSLLYSNLGKKLIIEMSVLMAISILFIMDYERLQKTNDIVDATKTGKKIMDYKALTGTLSGILFSAVLCSVTWIYFFYCVSFKGLWNVSVASALVAEKREPGMVFYPFITFFKITQIQYLFITLIVYLGIILLIALATIVIQFFLENSYFSFSVLVLFNMLLFLGAYYFNGTFMDVILHLLNPITLYITSGGWFMENNISLSFAGNEFWVIGVSGVWLILCAKLARNLNL